MTGMTLPDAEPLTAYLAADGFLEPLLEELGPGVELHDRLVLAPGPVRPAAWAQNIWPAVERIPIGVACPQLFELRLVHVGNYLTAQSAALLKKWRSRT